MRLTGVNDEFSSQRIKIPGYEKEKGDSKAMNRCFYVETGHLLVSGDDPDGLKTGFIEKSCDTLAGKVGEVVIVVEAFHRTDISEPAMKHPRHASDQGVIVGSQKEQDTPRLQKRPGFFQVPNRILQVFKQVIHGDDVKMGIREVQITQRFGVHDATQFLSCPIRKREAYFDPFNGKTDFLGSSDKVTAA